MNFEYYYYFTYFWIAVAIITFIYLFRVTAPYGRHSTTQWGWMIDNKLAWFIMEFFVLVVLYSFLFWGRNPITYITGTFIGLFSIHYINRSIIFPLRIRTKGKKMPIVIMFSAMFFNLVNGFLIGFYMGNMAEYPETWFFDVRFMLGTSIFAIGLFINWKADFLLINLRKPNEVSYKIPEGWLFRYISCPNLFGEILEWLGFVILTWSLPALTFFIWTFANLVPRAWSHHRWYQAQFPDYPKERKAVFPFIF